MDWSQTVCINWKSFDNNLSYTMMIGRTNRFVCGILEFEVLFVK